MASVNKCIFIGNLSTDVEQSTTQNGNAMSKFSMAVNGLKPEDTFFIKCTAFGKTAENAGKYLAKGNLTYVEGRLSIRKYDTSSGGSGVAVELIVDSIQFLPRGGQNSNATREEPQAKPTATPKVAGTKPPQPKAESQPFVETNTVDINEIDDNDIPF